MALEAVVFPQDPLVANYAFRDFRGSCGGGGGGGGAGRAPAGAWSSIFDDLDLLDQTKPPIAVGDSSMETYLLLQGDDYSPPEASAGDYIHAGSSSSSSPLPAARSQRKRRRTRTCKNKEDVENQRMTHIAVERNRRKQMNEYLAVLRSLMPPSYVQRGDQASTIGGAINYVKELEQCLHAHEAQWSHRSNDGDTAAAVSLPFADFFSYPQYAAGRSRNETSEEGTAEDPAGAAADVEVTMVESHANIKLRSKRRPKQLVKMVAAFESLRLTTVHLNVATAAGDDPTVLYSLSVKAGEGCQLTTADDVAAAANHILKTIHEEAAALH